MNLAVILPTIGRPTLVRALDSVEAPCIVVVDGEPAAGLAVQGDGVTRLPDGPHNDYGGAARNAGLEVAQRDGVQWVAYLDDDDVWVPGATAVIEWALAGRDPKHPELHVFRADFSADPRVHAAPDGCLWVDRILRKGNVSTQMLVHSLPPLGHVRWRSDVYENDFCFAVDLAAAGFDVHWHEPVIVTVRPGGGA